MTSSNISLRPVSTETTSVTIEEFTDDYNEDINSCILGNPSIMAMIAEMKEMSIMSQTETENKLIINDVCYHPSPEEIHLISDNLSSDNDIKVISNANSNWNMSCTQNYEISFTIADYEFGVQCILFSKAFMFIRIVFIQQTQRTIAHPTLFTSMNDSSQMLHVSKEMSNLVISVPNRKPMNDESGMSTISVIQLFNETIDNNAAEIMDENKNSEICSFISVTDVSLKLSKLMTKITGWTIELCADIPIYILNARIGDFRSNEHMYVELQKQMIEICNFLKNSKFSNSKIVGDEKSENVNNYKSNTNDNENELYFDMLLVD